MYGYYGEHYIVLFHAFFCFVFIIFYFIFISLRYLLKYND